MSKPITRSELAAAIHKARQYVAENQHGPPHETVCDAFDILAAEVCPPEDPDCGEPKDPPNPPPPGG